MKMDFHKTASIFPMMTEEEITRLTEDIREHGQLEPIYTYHGKIIDGRNRYKACKTLNIKPIYEAWDENGSLIDFVISKNLHRRHLTPSQKAVIALDILPYFEAEAKKKIKEISRDTIKTKLKGIALGRQTCQELKKNKSINKAAKIVGCGSLLISKAKKIQEIDLKKLDEIKQGTKTMAEVISEIRATNSKKAWKTWNDNSVAFHVTDDDFARINEIVLKSKFSKAQLLLMWLNNTKFDPVRKEFVTSCRFGKHESVKNEKPIKKAVKKVNKVAKAEENTTKKEEKPIGFADYFRRLGIIK
jgi:ParB-like chromosome segregation protein Spo0J